MEIPLKMASDVIVICRLKHTGTLFTFFVDIGGIVYHFQDPGSMVSDIMVQSLSSNRVN